MRICGPIIATSDIELQQKLYGPSCLGLQSSGVFEIAQDVAASLLGEPTQHWSHCWMDEPTTHFGVRLWHFSASKNTPVRHPSRGTDRDAPKVIDFYAPDFELAVEKLVTTGWNVKDSIGEYDLPEGSMKEAHLWGPDNVVTAVISGPADFFKNFATLCSAPFSEPQSISTPVTNLSEACLFYQQVFGLSAVYEYEIESKSFDALVGTDDSLKLKAVNIGVSTKEPYMGLIDYGSIDPHSQSLHGETRPPARGLLGVEMLVNDLSKIIAAAQECDTAAVLSEARQIEYPPYGAVRSAFIEGPHGMLHHVMERV